MYVKLPAIGCFLYRHAVAENHYLDAEVLHLSNGCPKEGRGAELRQC